MNNQSGIRGLLLLLAISLCWSCGQKEEKQAAFKAVPLLRPDLSALNDNIADDLRQLHRRIALKVEEADLSNEEKANNYGELAHAYYAHTFRDAALAALENAHLAQPDSNRWLYYLGFVSKVNGDNAAAERWFKQLLANSSYDFLTNLRLGDLYADEQRWDEASECYIKAQKVQPDNAAVYYGLGRVASAKNDDAAAVANYSKTLALQPGATIVNYPLGLAYGRLGERTKADFFLKRRGEVSVSVDDTFVAKARRLVDIALFDSVLHMAMDHEGYTHKAYLGYVRSNLRGKPDLLRLLQGVAQKKINSTGPDNIEAARLFYAIGDLQSAAGDKAEAIKTLAYAARLDPTYTELFLDLARTHLELGLFEPALKLMDSFVSARPDYVDGRLLHASALIGLGDADHMKRAYADLNGLLAETPEQYPARVLLAQAYFKEKKLGEAIKEYEKVVSSEMPDQERAQHYNTYARLIQENGQLAKAAELLEKSLQYDPGYLESRYDLGSLNVQRKRFKEAAAVYSEVIAANPQLERAHLSRAAAWILAENYNAAIADLDESLIALPSSVALGMQLARLLSICPKTELRDPAKALSLIGSIYRVEPSALAAETLAMALAQNGKWDEAISLQEALIASANSQGVTGAARSLEANLNRYRRKQLCCATVDAAMLIGAPQ